ncbi:MAG: hypothetical protein Q9195_008312 [Heterodermia aff. obscurata]
MNMSILNHHAQRMETPEVSDGKDTEIRRLVSLLTETHTKSITLAKLVNVPITTVEQLPALIQSITKHLESNIIAHIPNEKIQASDHSDEIDQQAEKAPRSFQDDEDVEDSQNTIEDSEEFLESDNQGTIEDGDDGHGEYLDADSARGDAEGNSKALEADVKGEKVSEEDYSNSSFASQNRSHHVYCGIHAQRRLRNGRAKIKTPGRFPIYQQKQILLSPEPEGL